MSISFMAASGGTLLAAAGTIVAVVRFARTPRLDLIAWTIAAAGLTVALAAQALGYHKGFTPKTFRALQISAQLIAPLALAWGIAEVAARSVPARFLARLALSALAVVSGVILAIDPLTAQGFGVVWPAASAHYQFPSSELLVLIAAVTVVTAVVGALVAGLRSRGDRAWRSGFAAVGVASLAAFAAEGLGVRLPANSGYPALTLLAAVLAVLASLLAGRFRPAALRGSGDAAGWGQGGPADAGRYGADDSLGLYRDSGQGGYPAPAGGYGSADGYGGYGDAGYAGPDADYDGPVTGAFERPVTGGFAGPADGGFQGPDTGGFDGPVTGAFEGPVTGTFERPMAGFEGPDTGSFDGPVTGTFDPLYQRNGFPGADDGGPYEAGGGHLPAEFAGPAAGELPAEFDTDRLYGQIAIYTLLEHGAGEFDRLAEQVVEQVRAHEPDTLVYVVHGVPSAPLQRIMYEIYSDQAAYDDHARQPYIREFEVGRLPLVLATNVIELGVRQAKVTPLGPPFGAPPLGRSSSGPLSPGPLSPGPLSPGPLSSGPRSAGPRSPGLPAPGLPVPGLPVPGVPLPGSRPSGPRSAGPSGPSLAGPRSLASRPADLWSPAPHSSGSRSAEPPLPGLPLPELPLSEPLSSEPSSGPSYDPAPGSYDPAAGSRARNGRPPRRRAL